MITKTTQDLAAQIRAEVARLAGARAELIAERDALTEERESLLNAPLNREDTKAFMLAYVDMTAAEWIESANWPSALRELTYPNRYPGRPHSGRAGIGEVEPLSLRDHDSVLSGDSSALSTILGGSLKLVNGHADRMRLTDGALFALFGDVLKPKLSELFDRHYPGPLPIDEKRIGPPIAERRARIAEIDQSLSALAERIAEIESSGRELGANLSAQRPEAARQPQSFRYEPSRQARPYTVEETCQLTGLEAHELRECKTLRPLPHDASRPGVRYNAEAVRSWMREHRGN